jgi:hypothetical protein
MSAPTGMALLARTIKPISKWSREDAITKTVMNKRQNQKRVAKNFTQKD